MKPSTVLRLALAGSRTDTLRVVLTAASAGLATLMLLAAATVLTVGPGEEYAGGLLPELDTHSALVVVLLSLTIPVLTLAAQCARLGSPARERRLAALRMAGATPRQVVAITAAESGLASLLGSAAGLTAYLVVRTITSRSGSGDVLGMPTDVALAPWLMVTLCLIVPLLIVAIAAFLLRRVLIGPFGVVRRARLGPPHWWPMILVFGPLTAVIAVGPRAWIWSHIQIPDGIQAAAVAGSLFGGLACACIGVGLGAGWIAHTSGRILGAFARRPSTLVAARRLMDDPWSGSRTFGTLLVSVFLGACVAGLRAYIQIGTAVREEILRRDPSGPRGVDVSTLAVLDLFGIAVIVAILIATTGLLVALVERSLAHRRTYASLVAAGIPRSVLARAALWQVAVPMGPALALALAAFVRASIGTQATYRLPQPVCPSAPPCGPDLPPDQTITFPVPWDQLVLIGGGAFVSVLAVVGLSLLFLRSSTDLVELRTA